MYTIQVFLRFVAVLRLSILSEFLKITSKVSGQS